MRTLTAMVMVVACVLLAAQAATAQTVVINPTTVEFTPSPDHDALALDGSPLVASYLVEFRLASDPTRVVSAFNLGKPTPVAGSIRVTNVAMFAGLQPNVKYIACVGAMGAAGEGTSAASNPFGNQSAGRPGGTPVISKQGG